MANSNLQQRNDECARILTAIADLCEIGSQRYCTIEDGVAPASLFETIKRESDRVFTLIGEIETETKGGAS